MKNKHPKTFLTTLFLLCCTTLSAQDFEVGGIFYNILSKENKTVEVTYKGPNPYYYLNEYIGKVTIPANVTYNGTTYNVTTIKNSAFDVCPGLISIEIPNSVTTIGDNAFGSCDGLTSIVVAEDNTIYDSREDCNAIIETATNTLIQGCKNTIIPNSVTTIGNGAFFGFNSLTSIKIPNSVTTIGQWAFYSCTNLTSIEIPNSVTTIEKKAFGNCESLTSVTSLIPADKLFIPGEDAFYNVPTSCTLYVPAGAKERYAATYGWNQFTNIVESANNFEVGGIFYNILSEEDRTVEVTYKGADQYDYSNEYIGEVTIPANVTYNGTTYNVTTIGESAFYDCDGLTSVTIGNSVTTIGEYAFAYCDGLTSIEIPNSVTTIGNNAFQCCYCLTSVTIGNSVTTIGDYAFSECWYLTSIEIPNSVTTIGDYAFYSCHGLTSVTIGNSVTTIGDYAFYSCEGLTSVTIGNSVTTIGDYAFYSCEGLTSVTIGNSVTTIGDYAFSECYGLTSITSLIPADKLFIPGANAFYNVPTSCTLYVPAGAKETYAATEGWCEFTNIVESANNFEVGGIFEVDGIFYNILSKEDRTVEVTYKGADQYDYNEYIGEVTIPANVTYNGTTYSVTTIGEWAFTGCIELTSVTIGNSVTTIGDYAFSECDGLTSVTIGNSVTTIGEYAFGYCEELTSITIPNSVTTIGNSAFYGCRNLTSIEIPNSVTTIGDYAFYYCRNLTSIEIPNSVTTIGERAFYNCRNITSITSLIPADKLFIPGAYAFYFVPTSCTLYVPAGAKEKYAATEGWNQFTNIVELVPNEITITVNQYGCATYCSEFTLDFSNVEGLKAYAATGYKSNSKVVILTKVQTAEGGVGLFLKGEPGEYVVPIIESTDEHSLNMLVGTLEPTIVNGTEGGMTNFKFTIIEGEDTPMFYQFEDNTPYSANRAYLQIPTAWLPATAAQKSVSISFEESETTGIDEVEEPTTDEGIIYNLQGQKVENPTRGIYIVNGKKVFIK